MIPAATGARPERLDILDALRGSALLGMLLLHAVEHWGFMRFPQSRPSWLEWLDGRTAFARWWLARYAYGPLEWLWRAATLRVPPWPLLQRPTAGAAGGSP